MKQSKLKLIGYSIIIGILVGLVVVAYRILLDKVIDVRNVVKSNIYLMILLFILIPIIIQKMLEHKPMISGSGIPQVMGNLKGRVKSENPLLKLIYKFSAGVLAIFTGLSLGREGPSIHIGSLVSDSVTKLTKFNREEKTFIVTAGASAGLSAAFNAPLAGTIFALEELHKFFSPILLICTIVSSIFANLVSEIILGKAVAFSNFSFVFVPNTDILSISFNVFLIFILSIIMFVTGNLFIVFLLYFQKLYKLIRLNKYIKAIIISFLSMFFVFYLPDVTGGGHDLIDELLKTKFSFKLILILLVFKFIFTMISYSTSSPGGIFLPLLVVGALIGRLYGIAISHIFNLGDIYITQYMLLGMAAYFVVIVKAPITGIVLILEMTGNFSNLFALTIVSAFSYILTELVDKQSIYEHLYDNMFRTEDKIND